MRISSDSSRYNFNQFLLLALIFLFLIVSLILKTAKAETFILITPNEYVEAHSAEKGFVKKNINIEKNDYPQIIVESPKLTADSLTSPVNIIVRFETSQGDSIDMNSLLITYGFFMDITERILQNADIGDDFIQAHGAELPSGKHSFTIRIKDSAGRRAEKEFKVVVL